MLLPGEDGRLGKVTLKYRDRTVILDAPLAAAEADTSGRIKKDVVSPEKVERIFASTLAAHPPAPVRFIIYYDAANIEVTAESRPTLEALLAEVAKRSSIEVEITGHTDRVGSVEDNDRLALMRAQTIRDKLIQLGLHADFIRAVGRGEREPLVLTPDEQPEPRNRRIEVIIR